MSKPSEFGTAIQELCKALAQRSASVFLGAGMNAGLTRPDGTTFPLGAGLAKQLAASLPNDDLAGHPLTHVAELVEFQGGRHSVNDMVREALSGFPFGSAHAVLATLPFDSIWTTNYDLLLEEAFAKSSQPAGVLKPIFSSKMDVSGLGEDAIPYYKLHGSIDEANKDGHLVLTQADYRHYEKNRRTLFARLQRDLMSRRFLFIGYSLQDQNFRNILDDCLSELGTQVPPHSFAIMQGFNPTEAAFWKSKYNVSLLHGDTVETLNELRDTWLSSGLPKLSAEERERALYFAADEDARFRRVSLSYYVISSEGCSGESDAKAFYRGAPPRWADVRDDVLAERRRAWDLLDALAPELEGTSQCTVYPVTGAAGTGKTSVIKWALWQAHKTWNSVVVQHIPGTPLDAAPLGTLVTKDTKRIVLYVISTADQIDRVESFIHESRALHLPITLVLEERSALWSSVAEARLQRFATGVVELSQIDEDDVDAFIDKLDAAGCLGALEDKSPDERRAHFLEKADKELLVALRELTESHGSFDELIRTEFQQIRSATARKGYALVAAVSQADAFLRLEVISRVLGVNLANLHTDVLKHTTGVLLTTEQTGGSRHSQGYRVRTRHPIIASIVFDEAAPSDAQKLPIIESLLRGLDPGYAEDRFLLRTTNLYRRLTDCLTAPNAKRSVFALLEELLPDDPYVLQHRSLLERTLRDSRAALDFATRAVAMRPHDAALNNTLGMAYELAARTADPTRRERLLSQAERIFDDGISSDPSNAYGHLGRVAVLRQRTTSASPADRVVLEADIIHALSDAMEATNRAPQIVSAWAAAQRELSDSKEVLAELKSAFESHPDNERVLEQYAGALLRARQGGEAVALLRDGVKRHNSSWRLNLLLAQALRTADGPEVEIKSSYQQAIRQRKDAASFLVEYGGYLFVLGQYTKANEQFDKAKTVETQTHRRAVSSPWKDKAGNAIRFHGKVGEIRGQIGFIVSIPDNFEVRFLRASPRNATLRQGERVEFTVSFSAYGAEASVRHPRHRQQ